MIKLIWSIGILLLLSGCGWDGAPTRINDFVPLTSIKIEAVSGAIAAHTSTKLTAIGDYSGLFSRDISDRVVWASNSPATADFVTPLLPGRVTGLVPGSAVLTATAEGLSASFELSVSSSTITSLTITPVDQSLAVGLTSQFAVAGVFSDATVQDLTFDVTWDSSATSVASVSNAAASKGFAQTLAIGTSTISATFDDVTAATSLTVTEPKLQTITLSPQAPSILTLTTGSFTAAGRYSDGVTRDITSQVTWKSSKTDIATISADGTATALTQGSATISATLDGISGTTNLTVTGGNLTAITLSPYSFTLVKDSVSRITATGSFLNGSILSSRDITEMVTWSTANSAVAAVTPSDGNLAWLKALAATTSTTITATYGSKSATAALSATAPQLATLTLYPTALEQLTAGTSSRFRLTATFINGITQDVTANADWSSSAVSTATVGNVERGKGRVSGLAVGSATISAEYGGKTVTAAVTVKQRTLQNLVISGGTSIVAGNQVAFTATATYSDGTSMDVTEETVWSIDDSNVIMLADSQNQPGQVVAVDGGSAEVTASFGNKTETTKITVH
ncbi:MAG: Ig-like domain-containing protein [Desulfuromonadaceae bacterium]|nr:Ig-like domain-containing protein [Desulfuromonadaceae bacterium]MDD5104746.1 Ig-like domain-containing protein [Desulfuromonadaceae bacterium]